MNRILAVFALLGLVTGCVSTPVLDADVADDLASSGVAAAFYMEGKKIQYNEMVYKVLWNETRNQESVFEGAWDIDREVTGTFSDSLAGIGLSSRPIYEVLSDDLYAEFEQAVLNTRGADGYNVSMSISDGLRDALLEQDVEYVVMLRAAHYYFEKYSGFAPACNIPSLLIVFDVRNNAPRYDELFNVGGKVAVEESVREVEANGLAKLKSATHDWVRTATVTRMPQTLGLMAAN